jgi:uncharacterized YccA/Bax inhibitor family protein
MMRTANPTLNAFRGERLYGAWGEQDRMTLSGTVNATLMLLGFLLITALATWYLFFFMFQVLLVYILMIVGAIGGLVVALVTVFRRQWAAYTAPVYAALEGFFLGGISAVFSVFFPGIVMEAVALTFGVFLLMLLIFRSGLIKVNRGFIIGVVAATGAVMIIYLASFFLNFLGIGVPYIHGNGPIGIGFSVIVVAIAALNLMLDFYIIDEGVKQGAPKHMEWYGAFALMVTLIWLYIEILRLLAKLRSR